MESGRGSLPSSPQSQGLTGPYKSGLYFSPIGRVGQPKEDETCGSPSPVNSFGQRCLFPASRTDEVTKPQVSSVTNGTQCGAMTQAQESSKAKPIPVVQSHRPPLPSHYITHNQEAAVPLPSPPCPKTVVPFPNWTPVNPVGWGQWNPWGGQPSKVITYPNRNLISLSPTRHGSSLPLPTPKTPSQSPTACGTRNGLSRSTAPKTMSTTPRTMSTTTTNTMSATTNTMSATQKNMSATPKTMPTIPKTMPTIRKILPKSSAACSPLLPPAWYSPSSFTSNPKTLSQTSSAACSAYLSPNARPSPPLSSKPYSSLLSPRPTPSLSSNPESPLLSPRPTPSLSSNPYSPLLSPRPTPSLSSNPGSPLLSPRPSPPLSSKPYSPLLSPRPSSPLSSKPYSPLLSPLTRPSPSLSSLLNPLTRPSPSLSSKPYSSLLNPLTRPSPSLSPSTSRSPFLTPTRQGMMSPSSTACKPSLSPLPRWPVVGHQDCASQQHKDNASNEESVPGGSTFLSMKRSRESESADISAKKLCVQDPRCVPPARSPVCTSAGQSLSPSSLAPKPSPSNVLSPKTAHGRLHTSPASGRSPCSALKQKLVQTKLSVSPPSETLARQSSSPLARLYLSPPPKTPLTKHQYVSPKLTPPLNRLSQTCKFTVTRPPSPHPPNSPFNRLPWSPTPKSPLTSVSLSPTPMSPLTRQAFPQPPKSPVTKLSLPQMPDFPLTPRALSQPPKSPATKLFLSQPPRPSASIVMPMAFTVKQSDKRSTDGPKDGSLNSWIAKCKRKVDDEGPPCPPLASTVAQKESKPKVEVKYQRRDDTKTQVRYQSRDDTEVLVKYQRRADTKGETSTRGQERRGTDRTSTKLKPNSGYVGRLSLKHKRQALGGHMTYDIFNFTPDSVHKPANTATGREKGPPATHKESCGSDSDRVADSGTFRVGSQCGLQRMAVVILDRVDLENMRLKRGGVFPSGPFFASSLRQRSDKRRTSPRKKNPRLLFQSDAPKEDTDAASKCHSAMPLRTSPCKKRARLCQSVVLKKEDTASECRDSAMPPHGSPDTPGVVCADRAAKTQADEDPLDLEVGMSFELDMKLSQSSSSSSSSSCEEEEEEEEEEQMRSMRELMDRITRQTAMPEPEHSNTHLVSSKMVHYKNTLDQTLLHITNTIESKANESRLLEDCKVDLLSEEAEDEQEEAISAEQREFLQRYALAPSSMRDVHPGEEVFHLDSAGHIFSQDSLQLSQCNATPQGTMQTTLLCSGPFQFRKHLRVDLPTSAYSSYPCPPDATRFLFKLMSVHKEKMAATLILNSLTDIAIAAADQRVRNGCQQFAVWVPSISEITLIFMNMGVPFVGLYPNESLQPAFTEGDVLEGIPIGSESPSSSGEPRAFPLHNFNYVLEYLDFCTRLCPCAYDDAELLLLLTVLCRLSLDVELVLQPLGKLHCLLESVVSNVSDWDAALPRMCAALVGLTADHHNMCSLVSKLPLHDRGQELRRHLSMCMISTLLDGSCTYQPAVGEFQLSALRDYLPYMRPSTLLHGLRQNARGPSQDDDQDSLDMQSYYLCNSLLTLMNEASNLQFYTTQQKEQLLGLCSELEFHVKSHIRESEKCLYRSTVKDLVARIYTRWQMLLLRTRPLNGQLYDYWKPVRMGSQSSAEGEEEPPIPEEEVEQEEMMEEDVVEEEEMEEEEEEEEEKERAGQQG